MRKFLIALVINFFLVVNISFAALDAGTVWEFRATNGTSTNGGGHNPDNASVGTDFSDQNDAQDSGTDLASADGDAVPCVVTSATHNFVAADNGNLIQIFETGDGFTVGFYEIVSTAGNAATLDRACGTDGAKTGGDWAYGGALDILTDALLEGMIAGNTIYVKNDGTMTLGGALDVANDGTTANPIIIEGYNASRGDNPTGTDRPLIAAAANATTFDNFWHFKNLRFTMTSLAGLKVDDGGLILNCKATNSSGSSFREAFTLNHSSNIGARIINSEAISTAGIAISVTGGIAIGNYIHDSTGGLTISSSSRISMAMSNVIDTCTNGITIPTGAGQIILNNTIYNSSTNCIGTGTLSNRAVVMNNILDNCGTGINVTASGLGPFVDWNNYTNNSTDVSGVTKGDNATALDPEFEDAANGDFGVGENMKSSGPNFPGTVNGLTTSDTHMDQGAVQREEPAAAVGGGDSLSNAFGTGRF